MLYSIATKLPLTSEHLRKALSSWVGSGDISNPSQLDFTIEYIKNWEMKGGADIEQLKKDCGVSLKLTNEEITNIVNINIEGANEKSKKF
jgi:hypothetical protein